MKHLNIFTLIVILITLSSTPVNAEIITPKPSAKIGAPANGTNHVIIVSWTWDYVTYAQYTGGYEVYWSKDNSNWTFLFKTYTKTVLNCTHSNIGDEPNMPYYYRVRLLLPNGTPDTDWGTMANPIYTACDNPAKPLLSNPTPNTIDLTIQSETPKSNPNYTTYSIYCTTVKKYVQTDGSLAEPPVFRTKAEWGTVRITGLNSQTNYCFYLSAMNMDGDVRNGFSLNPSPLYSENSFDWQCTPDDLIPGVGFPDKCYFVKNTDNNPGDNYWWSPKYYLPGTGTNWAMFSNQGGRNCPTDALKTGSIAQIFIASVYYQIFARTPVINCSSHNDAVVTFDLTTIDEQGHSNDRFYVKMLIGAQEYDPITPNSIYYLKGLSRNCERVELAFNLKPFTNTQKQKVYFKLYGENYNTNPQQTKPWGVTFDNFGVWDYDTTGTLQLSCLSTGKPCPLPLITKQPENASVCEGQNAVFYITANSNGGGMLSYQWMKDDNNIQNATGSSYTVTKVNQSSSGLYSCRITTPCGEVLSNTVEILIKAKPSVFTAPKSQEVCTDQEVVFNVLATGADPKTYKWQKNANDIAGATNNIFSINKTQMNDAGSYTCIITNDCGSITSDNAILTVNDCNCVPPVITVKVNNFVGEFVYCSRGGGGEQLPLTVEITGGSGCSGGWEFCWFNGIKYWDGIGFNSDFELWNESYTNAKATAKLGLNNYKVKARCKSFESCISTYDAKAIVMVSTGLFAKIIPPVNGLQHNIYVSWTNITGSDGYFLEYSNNKIDWFSLYQGEKPYFIHNTGDAPNMIYYYRLRVFKGNVFCDWISSSNYVYTACDFPILFVDNPTSNTIDLQLLPEQPVENPAYTKYAIKCQTTNQYVQIDSSLGLKDTFLTKADWGKITVKNLEEGKEYCFYALAKNEQGNIQSEGPELSYCETTVGGCIPPSAKDSSLFIYRQEGESLKLSSNCKGTKPFTYQWLKNNIEIPGATNSVFEINNLLKSDSANYYCLVHNNCGDIKMLIALLSIGDKPAIQGDITYDNIYNTPMTFSNVYLKNEQGDSVDTVQTTSSGSYLFSNVANGNYSLDITSAKAFKGSNPIDALIINRYFIGKYNFTNALRKKAADVSFDNKINPIDALMINRRFIGILKKFNSGDWLFEKSGILTVENNNVIKNLKAICYGDVNGSYPPSKKIISGIEFSEKGSLLIDKLKVINMPVFINRDLKPGAIGLILNYNKDLINIIGVESVLDGLIYNIESDKLSLAWSALDNYPDLKAGDVLLTLKVEISDNILSTPISLFIPQYAIMADIDANEISGSMLSLPKIIFNDNYSFELGQNYPNPYNENTKISYTLPGEGKAKLSILNLLGEEINIVLNKIQSAGNHSIEIDNEGLEAGLYFYKLEFIGKDKTCSQTKTMIIVR
ncbi:MAG: immunoglobulin domain-containing protein [Bacteroidales bacterium]|nr:immunoglobulin domain-containing protein [Bacteroidales bacterium]